MAAAALIGAFLWASTEASQQMLTLFAFDDWRRAWLAGDPAVRATMEVRAAIYDGLWDAAYGLLLIGFTIANLFFAVALWRRGGRLARVVAGFLTAAAALSVVYFAQEIVGGPLLPGGIGDWIYPAVQPLGRLLIGVWLWRLAADLRAGRPSDSP